MLKSVMEEKGIGVNGRERLGTGPTQVFLLDKYTLTQMYIHELRMYIHGLRIFTWTHATYLGSISQIDKFSSNFLFLIFKGIVYLLRRSILR